MLPSERTCRSHNLSLCVWWEMNDNSHTHRPSRNTWLLPVGSLLLSIPKDAPRRMPLPCTLGGQFLWWQILRSLLWEVDEQENHSQSAWFSSSDSSLFLQMYMQKNSLSKKFYISFSSLGICPAALLLLQLGECHNVSALQTEHASHQIPHTAGLQQQIYGSLLSGWVLFTLWYHLCYQQALGKSCPRDDHGAI